MTKITVFGSGTVQENSPLWNQAYEIGFLLAKEEYVVLNGGYGGTMLASARGAKDGSGKTIGVTTDEFPASKKNEFIDQEIRKRTWRERLFELIDLGDGFVVLDGETGTLAELLIVWEMRNKNLHQKPIVILGERMQALVRMLKENPDVFLPQDLSLVSTPKEAVEFLQGCLGRG